jgi:hypothetical protein
MVTSCCYLPLKVLGTKHFNLHECWCCVRKLACALRWQPAINLCHSAEKFLTHFIQR